MTRDFSKMKFKENILETVGKTPLVRLNRVAEGVKCQLFAKVEFFNPGGSVKDRIGMFILNDAIKAGKLKPGGTIVECTSGNTGAGLAIAAAVLGYKAIFTMPDKMSKEKIRLLKSYGAEVITCPTNVAPDDPQSYYSVAKRIVEETDNAVLGNQYYNPMNPEAHYHTTGPEIWADTAGMIDYFVAGVGTGGTISGTARYLKEQNPNIQIVGADPEGSMLREYFYTKNLGDARPYLVEGIGEDIIPDTFQPQYIDDIYTVGDKESFRMARRLSREEGLMVGGSCGSAAHVAVELAKTLDEDKVVVVLLPDTGERYLSKFHSDEWMRENQMLDDTPGDELLERNVGSLIGRKTGELPPIVSINADAPVAAAIDFMKKNGVTQLPVQREGEWVGKVLEGELLDSLLATESSGDQSVSEVMTEPFPILSADAHYAEALKLFAQRHLAVIVKDGDHTVGILTKSDLVDHMLANV